MTRNYWLIIGAALIAVLVVVMTMQNYGPSGADTAPPVVPPAEAPATAPANQAPKQ